MSPILNSQNSLKRKKNTKTTGKKVIQQNISKKQKSERGKHLKKNKNKKSVLKTPV